MHMRAVLTTLLTVTMSLASAAPVTLTPLGAADNFLLLGNGALHYRVNPDERTVLILEGQIDPASSLPAGVQAQVRPEGLLLTLPETYRVTLSADERRLQFKRLSAIQTERINVNDPLRTDERAPLILPLANALPGQVASQLTQMYPGLRVVVDDRQRTLLVMGNPADRALIQALVAYLDTPRPQVSFEAEVLEINRTATQKLGIDYDLMFKIGVKETNIPTSTAQLPFRIGQIVRDAQQGIGLFATINLLQNNGAGRILARPRVVTLDGTEARINATQNTPLVVTTNNVQTVQNIATGITLRMLPRVAPDGTVEVQVSITVSAPTGVTAQGVPTYSNREASTLVRVQNGQPIVIGGLLENRQIEGTNKIPLLGDIPFLGKVFSSTTTNTSDTDLVIIITPRLLLPAGTP